MHNLGTIILAAGMGTRMKSIKPKVLHEILGQPLLWYPIAIARRFSDEIIAVIGHGREQVGPYLDGFRIAKAVQDPPLGTGHAVLQACEALERMDATDVLIIPGDMPLIDQASIGGLIERYRDSGATMGVLTAELDNPFGYGRIVRDKQGRVKAVVEENDAKPAQKKIREVNTAVYIVKKRFLLEAVGRLKPNNVKGELYLTDIVTMADTVVAFPALDAREANGINSRAQLAEAAAMMQARINRAHMLAGVTLIDPATTWIGPQVKIAQDVEIWPNTHLLGVCEVMGQTRILPGTWLRDATIGRESVIGHHCIIEHAGISAGSSVPPFSKITG